MGVALFAAPDYSFLEINSKKFCRFPGAFACILPGEMLTFLLANALERQNLD